MDRIGSVLCPISVNGFELLGSAPWELVVGRSLKKHKS
jgi:hypothetical protein